MEKTQQKGKPVVQPLMKAESDNPGMLRKKHRLEGQRICRVCGDKAVAFNFDVISCESCKTFFRRNAFKPEKECAFEGKCEITISTRRFCPACRLKKCFDIGMRADMILDEAGRKARMDKIAENRKKRKLEAVSKGEGSSSSSESKTGTQNAECDSSRAHLDLINQDTATSDVAGAFLDLLAEDVPEFSQSDNASDQQSQAVCDQGQGQGHEQGQKQGHEQIVQNGSVPDGRCRVSSFDPVPSALLPSDPLMYWRLTAEEHTLLTKLTVDYKETLLRMPTTPEAIQRRFEDMTLEETLAFCDPFACDMISFIKRLPEFRALQMNDQLAAVKGNGMQCYILKTAACFSEERDAWVKDFGEVPVSEFARMSQHPDIVNRHANLCRTLKRILKNDYTGFALLNLMVLFDPQAEHLFDRQTFNTLYDKYSILLKHHMESQHSYLFAKQYVECLWDCLHDNKLLAAEMTVLFNGWKDIITPLLAEVFDLK